MAIQGARPKDGAVAPHLVVRGAKEAVEFYQRAFGARTLYGCELTGGMGWHFHIRVGDALVMVTDEMPPAEKKDPSVNQAIRLRSPLALGGNSVVLDIIVNDVDAAFKKAVDAGAAPALPPMDWFWGDRYGMVADPFGHVWAFSQVLEELTPEEAEQRMNAFYARAQNRG